MSITPPSPLDALRLHTPASTTTSSARVSRWRLLLRGAESDPSWVRPGLWMLLAVTALLYLFGLSASGYANTYYAAAVQAATRSWKAFFFGSSDAANFITVDKPPLSLWPSALAARVFGVNPWTVLAPQALEGVASVGVLYATVRRWFAPQAALLAGAVLALTPVAALMFRFNNPDALLTLLLVLGAYATVRALERAGTGWLLLAASCLGLGFLTKMLQALLVVPAFALVYGIAAPTSIRRRLVQFALAGIALVASAGWWVAIVELVPASARPYIGGSQTNSVLELTFGYNGFGRLTGNQVGSVGGAMGWGQTGWARLVGAEVGGQIAWLLPAALILLAGGLWLHRRAPRTDRTRAALLLWGGWLLVTGLVFSFMRGIFHAYYTVALAPAIGALVGIGAVALWRQREHAWARLTLAGAVAATGVWSYVLLQRTPAWLPWLAPVVLLGGLLAALAVAGLLSLRLGRGALAAVVAGALVVVLAGPAAYAVQTAATPHGDAIPSAGPATAVGFGRGGFPRGGLGGPGQDGGLPFGRQMLPGAPGGGGPPGGFGGGGGLGGLLNGSEPSAELVALLQQDAGDYTWVAAIVGANSAAGIQLTTGDPVLAIGGFNGTDPTPTLAQFQQFVREGRIHYFIRGGGGPGGGSGTASQVTSWVEERFTAATVAGATVYDLTAPATTAATT